MSELIHITIDGPSGAGKSTIARAAAQHLGFLYVDTGAVYRAAALGVLEQKTDPADAAAVALVLPLLDIVLLPLPEGQKTMLNGKDISGSIRTEEISSAASLMAQHACVRTFADEILREIAATKSLVMDGRDIGTTVLPNAQIKLFLTASAWDRALRRYNEYRAKGEAATFDQVHEEILARDKRDETRENSPLCCPQDAVVLDTTGNSLEESVQLVLNTIKERMSLVL